ncbi:bifunctional phosphopantothenoylcysteine decarboxylase/phosphopantothenate--cysteine ligase CoaBC [Tindallia californiensis]|uniref:Coenzyme A biosynthesis bifunctional protein CoaBC n=1 Tax=Tindallia californiensis TaxID=159292 RepID=A0A1H3NVJ0_9FIRM|nr:bifunctional phosphopantothenoylcysteine decarboxylase/phosphopantothenate--cysteine ligase CoaBC [Tindallia californiensis]SDY92730.1 phosphopantothenoylcysteine decarboxylase / phosphopantothenate--cysteine ligase [Tindallia californiensis]
MLQGKHIVVGVTGGIAAYKACELVSRLSKQQATVEVVMTEAATSFVNPETFQALSRNPVITSLFQSIKYWEIEHISLAQKTDAMIVAPATANIIGKVANGIADDFLSTMIMASTVPVILAPAMNTYMYENPILQRNVKCLKGYGYHFVDPYEGLLACGDKGKGKMAEPAVLEEYLINVLMPNQDLVGQHILITAGPTREEIDPVRYITNYSSGKMGYALAEMAKKRGALVTLITGPCQIPIPKVDEVVSVLSTEEMLHAVMSRYEQQDVVIKAAAVSDYRPTDRAVQKIKKQKEGSMELSLTKNPDILWELGKTKNDQILVGFAAETENLIENATSKMNRKNLDLMVANDLMQPGAGFHCDTNQVMLLYPNGQSKSLKLEEKKKIADGILDEIAYLLKEKKA